VVFERLAIATKVVSGRMLAVSILGRASLGVWILSIARILAIDYMRSSTGRFTRFVRPIENCEFLYSTSGSGAYNFEMAHLLVQAAFLKLTFNQQRALELAYFQSLSQSEIAEQL
jgi:DNA-directed RNA polymerase specialized sigma24 family protein